MVPWHETLAVRIGMRLVGLGILSMAAATGRALYAKVHAHPPAQATLPELGLCAVLVVLLLVGAVMVSLGAVLCRSVPVPGRWSVTLGEGAQPDAPTVHGKGAGVPPKIS
ncbi:hypothetical protein [Novosphingobium guangzhouense]|uniref:hypothetical protein n=1 Tax=Novosphingobium guangzhouense TaxID=1850347 RepID=UPI001B807900|nr:hypothetical protein [Novosphingobium guangzhouense]